jgi:hypothetical protein
MKSSKYEKASSFNSSGLNIIILWFRRFEKANRQFRLINGKK